MISLDQPLTPDPPRLDRAAVGMARELGDCGASARDTADIAREMMRELLKITPYRIGG